MLVFRMYLQVATSTHKENPTGDIHIPTLRFQHICSNVGIGDRNYRSPITSTKRDEGTENHADAAGRRIGIGTTGASNEETRTHPPTETRIYIIAEEMRTIHVDKQRHFFIAEHKLSHHLHHGPVEPWIATYVEFKTMATTEIRRPARGAYYGIKRGHAYGAHGVSTPRKCELSEQHRRGDSTKYPRILGSHRARSLASSHRGAPLPHTRQGNYFTYLGHCPIAPTGASHVEPLHRAPITRNSGSHRARNSQHRSITRGDTDPSASGVMQTPFGEGDKIHITEPCRIPSASHRPLRYSHIWPVVPRRTTHMEPKLW